MSKRQPREPVREAPETAPKTDAVVLFGGRMTMLPKELEQMGLAGKVTVQEIPGVPPNWKPAVPNDYLLGKCVAVREKEFDTGTPRQRIAHVAVFDTAIPGGFRSVWLGADLKIKLTNPVGKVYQIVYTGDVDVHSGLNPMKAYTVYEIEPKEIPPQE